MQATSLDQGVYQDLLKHPGIWRGDGFSAAELEVIDTGHPVLRPILPGGGWPQAAITELIPARNGCGELRLLLPALASLTRQQRQVVLVAPPYIPYPPAWQAAGVQLRYLTWIATESADDAQWAMEQALRESACGAVLGWFASVLADRNCRRLQLAAEKGRGCGFVLRPGRALAQSSPFTLRLGVEAASVGTILRILKRRGVPYTQAVCLPHAQGEQPLPPSINLTPGANHHAVARAASAQSAAGRIASLPHANPV